MTNPILNGPQAPESNPRIDPQFFQPSRFSISAIAFGKTTTVTTLPAFGVNNNYVVGQLVRFLIPSFYGTRQLDEQQAYVVDLPTMNQVTVNIDTSQGYDAFIPSPSYGPTAPSISAIGDINSGVINASGPIANGTFIPGSFINISPAQG